MKYPAVIDVRPQDNFILHLAFDNGENGFLDMKPYLDFGIFVRIKSPHSFVKVRVSFDTVEWESGADIDPEVVYSNCKKINESP
ncbi:MAG: Protein of unknown function (DUF2442) [Candidatus Electronema aureum]|uniref:DUF2442 domain-containing protein n=1 Tax=Candidatus Electronema aureum TaxID=2005002 RepID=A0A521G545_9BACT|nr:MAG: Protein of unknown function (DUF2442) [Candidatus Electronema aureum]